MRLWHKELIPVLPMHQLLAQWRECCCIAKNIAMNGTPNHILVNKVLEYPVDEFESYCRMVVYEMGKREYRISPKAYNDLMRNIEYAKEMNVFAQEPKHELMFGEWHTDRYFWQCYFNLQEKHDCGGISKEEWSTIQEAAMSILSNSGGIV